MVFEAVYLVFNQIFLTGNYYFVQLLYFGLRVHSAKVYHGLPFRDDDR